MGERSNSGSASATEFRCDLTAYAAHVHSPPRTAAAPSRFYHTSLKPLLADWLMLWLRRNGLHDVTEEQGLACLSSGVTDPSVQASLSDRQARPSPVM